MFQAMLRCGPIFLALGCLTASADEVSQPGTRFDLFNAFEPGWREAWREQNLFSRPTVYTVAFDGSRPVLHARSAAANAGLLRRLPLNLNPSGRLSWRWKVKGPLSGRHPERSRAGDDYAARVFVVFEPSWLPLRTRAINYVWAAAEPVGGVYASPYTGNVGMIVLRSGSGAAGRWQAETRDLVTDYRAFFGVEPTRISAVAVLVDTDNTGEEAEAWFDDLVLEIYPPSRASYVAPRP